MSATWSEREALAEQLVPLVGQLHRNNKVVTTVFGRSLVHKSVTDIIKATASRAASWARSCPWTGRWR